MALILAIEPDRHQASQLTAIVRGRLHAELVIEATAERALTALGDRVPDLILTAALLSPKDETALATRLRELDSAAAHIHTITIPVLAAPRSRPRISGVLSALRRDKSAASEVDGCDPAVFAEQCATYLERAVAERRELSRTMARDEAAGVEETIAPAEASPVVTPTVDGGFEAPSLGEDFSEPERRVEEPFAIEQAGDEPAVAPDRDPAWDAPTAPSFEYQHEPVPEQTIGEAVEEELRGVVFVEPPVEEQIVEQPVAEEPMIEHLVDEHGVGQDAVAEPPIDHIVHAARPTDLDVRSGEGDHLLEESPLFELVTDVDAGLQAPTDAGTGEDPGNYIELDLSDFLDEAAPVVADTTAGENAAADTHETAAPGRSEADGYAADEGREIGATAPEPAAPQPEEDDWLEVVAALRRDVERLDATPAAAAKMAKPLRKPARKGPKGKPIQDEWGFFDPEQCGFAALLAKLDEITATEDPVRRRKRA
jgi:hypothetical protein